jgi:hypothetical protein
LATILTSQDLQMLINELITTQLGIRSDIRSITYQLRSK